MPLLYWDASALAKRYIAEVGSDAVDALFALVPASQMMATVLGYAETYSLRYTQTLSPGTSTCLLVAADQRLLTAAQAEGLNTLNPETIPAADVPAFLATF